MVTLEQAKTNLRITTDRLDDEIEQAIKACYADLAMAGVLSVEGTLADMAVRLYCRWQFGFDGKPERYEKAYTGLKNAMSLCGDYNGGGHV